MSFARAQRDLFRFAMGSRLAIPRFESIDAILDARRLNTVIKEGDVTKEGKYRRINISRYPIVCDAVEDNCDGGLCPTGTKLEPIQEGFNITRCIRMKARTLSIDDVRLVDGDYTFSDHALEQIRSMAGSANRELATQIDELILANAGLMLDGNATKRVTVVNSATGVVQPVGMWEIEQDFRDGGYQTPFMVGSKEVFQWKKALGIATENNTTGQDYAKLNQTNLYYDTLLNSVAGNTAQGEHIIVFDPDALKFVSYNENVGMFATDLASPAQIDAMFKRGGTFMRGVWTDPNYGISWDFYLRYNDCDGTWTFWMQLLWDIWFPMIQSCNRQGVNGIFHYRTCPVVVQPCPTGDLPSPAVPTSEFSWTPGDIFPLYVANMTLGGVYTEPQTSVANIAALNALMNQGMGGQAIFRVDGSDIEYDGTTAITGNINSGGTTITFA
jgi:hypothetical protein